MLRRMAVAAVELVRPQPDWEAALTRALIRLQVASSSR